MSGQHSSGTCKTPPPESVAHLPEPYRRWQCTCGAVWSLRDNKWEPLFMAPKSLRRTANA